MTSLRSSETRLRAALSETTNDPAVDRMIQQSIRASIEDEHLISVYDELAGPDQAELDLHLTGEGVDGHATNASKMAAFIAAMSTAVKDTAKHSSGKKRYSENLLVEGVSPGSVRVVMRVAPPEIASPSDNNPADGTVASSIDSDALRSIAAVLTLASSEDPDAPLFAELDRLPIGAKQALKRAATTARAAKWTMDGRIRQRNFGSDRIRFTESGALRLKSELNSTLRDRKPGQVTGILDGFRRSLGVLYIVPDVGPAVQVAVVDRDMLQTVSALAAEENARVLADIEIVRSSTKGDRPITRISRTLTGIRQLPPLGAQNQIFGE